MILPPRPAAAVPPRPPPETIETDRPRLPAGPPARRASRPGDLVPAGRARRAGSSPRTAGLVLPVAAVGSSSLAPGPAPVDSPRRLRSPGSGGAKPTPAQTETTLVGGRSGPLIPAAAPCTHARTPGDPQARAPGAAVSPSPFRSRRKAGSRRTHSSPGERRPEPTPGDLPRSSPSWPASWSRPARSWGSSTRTSSARRRTAAPSSPRRTISSRTRSRRWPTRRTTSTRGSTRASSPAPGPIEEGGPAGGRPPAGSELRGGDGHGREADGPGSARRRGAAGVSGGAPALDAAGAALREHGKFISLKSAEAAPPPPPTPRSPAVSGSSRP